MAGAVLAMGLGVASTIATPPAGQPAANTAADAPPAEEETTAAPEDDGGATPLPSPSQTEPKKIGKADYGGRVKGTGALIAISVRDGKAIGYFCDGRSEAWFKGTESDGVLRLKGVAHAGSKVTADIADGRAEGSVSVGGGKWRFVAPTVVKPSGLYRATALVRGAKLRAGWIVIKNADGGYDQVGAAFAGTEQVADLPRLDSQEPTAPVTVDDTTVYPEDVDAFIEEMR
ncbi:hypothetical protein FAF44_03570 [Nonomuraea sp. MG754425]|uniref:hypothetical protein n=1 Tax=Nonomuraea sp. MG754425 TaxID=2570319 RepID=UPI001F25B771|nr:hypothetical protein [Nonomuraea sp. MG754425]MCF6467494.1 hypothetical protein [Nonomuraea sp. MG754425]